MSDFQAGPFETMDDLKQHYLRAMGIDTWLPHPVVPCATDEPIPDIAASAAPTPDVHPVGAAEAAKGDESATTRPAPEPLDWAALAARVRDCTLCPELVASRSQTVFGTGDRNAGWMVIGEAPGADEDRQGEPFVGRAGQLLSAMLKAIGLERREVYIANVLKSRPSNNRDPQPDEVANCIPYLKRQIELVAPRIILVVGRIAAQNLLGTEEPIGRLRGQVHAEPATGVPVVVTYHPAYLLRSPQEKRKSWDDLRLALRVSRKG